MPLRPLILSLSVLISATCNLFALGTPPQISPYETRIKVQEILRAHYKYKQITPELARRALGNFLEEIDPLKLYFTKNEIDKWLNPDPDLLDQIVQEFHRERFTVFESIYALSVDSIQRRARIEAKIAGSELPKVKKEDKDWNDWAENDESLQQRLTVLSAMYQETANRFETEEQGEFYLQRVKNRKDLRESALIGSSESERNRNTLSYVIKAFAQALDTHTVYFTPEEASQFLIDIQQKLSGIGALLKDDMKGLLVVKIIENGPASKQKELRVGDRIIAVNHEPIIGLDILQSVDLIRGTAGTPVILTIVRESSSARSAETERFDIEIVRGDVVMKESRYEYNVEPSGDGVIAHLRLHSFYQDQNSSSAEDLKKALAKIKKEHNVNGVILDLRGNLGGLLPQAVAVSGLFLKKGIIVSIKDYADNVQHLRNFSDEMEWDGPLVILTDKASASASEIVAQALQDYGRAILVGDESTCGKGSYQTMTLELGPHAKVNPQGEYKVTRGVYYTVSGKSPQLCGVASHISVPGMYSFMNFGESESKYPLENESISPHFQDTFEDVHPLYKRRLRKAFSQNVQEPISYWNQFIAQLKENSMRRIANNERYQVFLLEAEKKEFSEESLKKIGKTDLQLEETYNITKDLIYLSRKKPQEP